MGTFWTALMWQDYMDVSWWGRTPRLFVAGAAGTTVRARGVRIFEVAANGEIAAV